MNLVWELNETARHCAKPDVATNLREHAIKINAQVSRLNVAFTMEAMTALNGAVVAGWRALNLAPPMHEHTPPRAGALREVA